MIIERKYCTFGMLYNMDEKSKKVIDKAFSSIKDKEDRELRFNYNMQNCLWNIKFGSGLPEVEMIRDEFAKLDQQYPFDNKLSILNVVDACVGIISDDNVVVLLMDREGNIIKTLKENVTEEEINSFFVR